MNQKNKLKLTLLAAVVALGTAATVSAQETASTSPAPAPAAADTGSGLLGTRYLGAAYDYIAFQGVGPNHAHGLDLSFNQPLSSHFDLNLGYEWGRAHYLGYRLTDQDFTVGTTAYTNLGWGKPFALVAAGWDFVDATGAHDNSFIYRTGVGIEFPVARAFSVAPYVNFARATGYNQNEFDYGVKAEYRVTRAVGITARVQYDAIRQASDQTEYSLGVNYHF